MLTYHNQHLLETSILFKGYVLILFICLWMANRYFKVRSDNAEATDMHVRLKSEVEFKVKRKIVCWKNADFTITMCHVNCQKLIFYKKYFLNRFFHSPFTRGSLKDGAYVSFTFYTGSKQHINWDCFIAYNAILNGLFQFSFTIINLRTHPHTLKSIEIFWLTFFFVNQFTQKFPMLS